MRSYFVKLSHQHFIDYYQTTNNEHIHNTIMNVDRRCLVNNATLDDQIFSYSFIKISLVMQVKIVLKYRSKYLFRLYVNLKKVVKFSLKFHFSNE